MSLLNLISGLKEPDLGLRGLRGMYIRMDGRTEIHPCVLQDIDPLGPLPKKALCYFVFLSLRVFTLPVYQKECHVIGYIYTPAT